MTSYSRRFINELGNAIDVQVSDETRNGIKGVLLYMAGPDSDWESFVTLQEAVELLEGLSRIVKAGRSRR